MNDLYSPESNLARQRKLDALFADQPFLSATMRASRLHERLDSPSSACVLQPLPEDADEILRRMVEGREVRSYETGSDDWWFASAPAVARDASKPKPRTEARSDSRISEPVLGMASDTSCLTFDVILDMTAEGPRVAKVHATDATPDVMTSAEAAAYLRVSLSTLKKWTKQLAVPHARFGRRLRYRRSSLLCWLAEWEKTI